MTTLEDLYIYYCRRCDCRPNTKLCLTLKEAYEAAGGQRQLAKLDLSDNYVGPRGIAPVLELARNIHNLVSLDIRNNMLEEEHVEMVARALARHPSIRSVDLSNNTFNDSSVPLLLFLLQQNQGIVELRIGGNDVLPANAERIEQQLRFNMVQLQAAPGNGSTTSVGTGDNGRYLPHVCECPGELTLSNSGGHFHFASWRKNPQFQLYVSTTSIVSIRMRISDPIATKQFGFAVVKGKGLVKAIHIDPSDILAESSFDHAACHVQLRLNAANRNRCEGPYLIIPFSFQPQRTCKFTLQCEIVEEPGRGNPGGIDEGAFVSLDPLDSRYDWEVNELRGTWSTDNAGGSIASPSWRDNVMYHLQYRGTAAAKHVASLFIVLTKSNDNDINDERSIGFYVMKKNATGPAVPVVATSENLVAVADHRRETSVCLDLETSCGSMDWYLMPTTAAPSQFGDYTLTVFSTCQVQLTPCHHPHGWASHTTTGVWDQERNGGSRKLNPVSWIHNPSYLVRSTSEAPIAIVASLEATSVVDGVQLMLLQRDAPDFPPMKVTAVASQEAILTLQHLPQGEYVLIATTNQPGQHGSYRLRIFTETAVYVSHEAPLSARVREWQISSYTTENEQRKAASEKVLSDLQQHALGAASDTDATTIAAEKEAAVQAYLSTGSLFLDREFPRGESSLWLGIDTAPEWAPAVASWRRPSEFIVAERVICATKWNVDQCRVSGGLQDEWFLGCVGAVSTRPDWLARVFRGYDANFGIAQFSFFKNGQWHGVSVDDYLPVDALDDLCFCSSHNRKCDVFLPLVEKAYAKFHRCYHALDRRLSPSTADAIRTLHQQGMMDLTGGLCWRRSIVTDADRIAQNGSGSGSGSWESSETLNGSALWHELRAVSVASDSMGSVMLASDAPHAIEKQHVGIVRDRLYTVLDARDVEGVRLVRLHAFWPEADSVRPFQGKWCHGSAKWTQPLLSAVDYEATASKMSFWMSLEEVEYYFSDWFVTKRYRHATVIEGGFSPANVGGPIQNDTWVENHQYALDMPHGDSERPLTLVVGVHQQDARCQLTRQVDTLVSYITSVGVTVFFTSDNTRRLATLSPQEYVVHSPIVTDRDCFLRITIDPKLHPGSNRIILMPFQTTPKLPLQCFLSVWNDVTPSSVTLIQSSSRTICEGEWRAGSSGGPPLCGTWRNNPQYHLYPSEGMEVTIVLRQRNDLSSTEAFIGFTVHRASSIRSLLHYDESDVVLSVRHENGHAVAGTVRLCGMQERRGMPYIIVPSTSKANTETGFTLEVIANKKVHMCRVPAATDWRSLVFPLSFRYAERNTGGSTRFSSWRNNPQYTISFPMEKEGNLLVSITNHSLSDDTEIGVALIRADEWDHGRRRKIKISAEDFIADSGEAPFTNELQTTVAVRGNEPIILMPYTATPLSEVTVTVSIFCTADVAIDVVKEWYTEVVDGSWELGLTAGGCRKENRTYTNNPSFHLTLSKPTRLLAVLIQYPRGPEPLPSKRIGKQRPFLLPPIVNPQNKICIGLDLLPGGDDEEQEPIAVTRHTYEGEVSMLQFLPPCVTTPYRLVPHTFEPEQEADFKIMLYSDEALQLQEQVKARRYF